MPPAAEAQEPGQPAVRLWSSMRSTRDVDEADSRGEEADHSGLAWGASSSGIFTNMWRLKRNGPVTLGLFLVLASVMFFTRNVDWYALGERE